MKINNKLSQALLIAFFIFINSFFYISQAEAVEPGATVFVENKLQIVITPDGYPIIWYASVGQYGNDFLVADAENYHACMELALQRQQP